NLGLQHAGIIGFQDPLQFLEGILGGQQYHSVHPMGWIRSRVLFRRGRWKCHWLYRPWFPRYTELFSNLEFWTLNIRTMNMTNKLKTYIGLFLAFLVASCDSYLDVNENPNNPEDAPIS